jgi:hypothetical protein
MPISLRCSCGRALKVKDELAEKKIRCPACKGVLTVPAKSISADEVMLEVIDDEEETPPPRPRRSSIQAKPPEAKPAKPSRADEVVLEVIDDDEEETSPRGPRRSSIQAKRAEVKPSRGRPVEDDDEPAPRKKTRPSRDIRRTPASSGGFGTVNAGVIGGVIMMLIAVVWFIAGLAGGIIFFYPPILFIIGIVAVVKGGLGNS